jgi:hypothetical protein
MTTLSKKKSKRGDRHFAKVNIQMVDKIYEKKCSTSFRIWLHRFECIYTPPDLQKLESLPISSDGQDKKQW